MFHHFLLFHSLKKDFLEGNMATTRELGTWVTKFDQITLYEDRGSIQAKVKNNKGEQWVFSDKQVTSGILGDISPSQMVEKIDKIGKERIAVCVYPKENPQEVWVFEAEKMTVADIKKGKEYLKQSDYKKALQKFETALKLQKKQKGSTSEIEKAIKETKEKCSFERFKKLPSLYLPNADEITAFEELIETYQDDDDIFESLETLLSVEKSFSPHHHLLAAIVSENKGDFLEAAMSYLELAEIDSPHTMACIERAYSLIEKVNILLRKDAVRMSFEKYLSMLSQKSPQEQAPTCFVCFNVEEKDVGKWLEETLVPDLDRVDIKPIFCFRNLSQGQDLDNFQEIARSADLVIIACTPDFKTKYEERKKAPVGLAQEIRMIKGRYHDEEKAHTIFPLYLKGTIEEALPTAYLQPIFGAVFAGSSDINYFSNAFELLSAMRKVPRETARNIKKAFLQEAKELLRGNIDVQEATTWRSKREEKQRVLLDSIAHRISTHTQMVNLPLPPKDFTGRKDELEKLHDACKHEHRVAITGLGGMGKTALTLQYANDHKASYQWIHYIPASTPQAIIAGLIDLANELYIPQNEKVEERLKELTKKLNRLEKDYLLIFDGVDDSASYEEILKYLPDRGKTLLVVSRLKDQLRSTFQLLPLGRLTSIDATDYLLKAIEGKDTNRAQAQCLAEKLDYLPLALKHAAAYIRQTPGYTFQRYLSEFDLAHFEKKNLYLERNEQTILTTWNKSINAIIEDHNCPLAKEVLEFLSILENAPFPLDLLTKWFNTCYPDLPDQTLSNALRHLQNYSLIESSGDTCSIHALVQKVSGSQLETSQKETFTKQAMQAFLKQVNAQSSSEKQDIREISVRKSYGLWVPHLEKLVQTTPVTENEEFQDVLEFLWAYYYYEGKFQQSRIYAELLLQSSSSDETRALALNHLGQTCISLGDKEAIKYLQEALKLCRSIHVEQHSDIATSLEHVGRAFLELGEFEEALRYFRESLEMRKSLLGEKHLEVGMSLNSIGRALQELGRFEEALKHLVESQELLRSHLGTKHPEVATSLNNIGLVLISLGKYEEALKYLKESLELYRVLLGEQHPSIAQTLNNVGYTLGMLGDYKGALKYQMEALKQFRVLLGEQHSSLGLYLDNVGMAWRDLGKYEEALKYQKEALELRRTLRGEKHPDFATSLDSIGVTYLTSGKHDEALKYLMEGLELRQALLGEQHPDTAMSLSNVGVALGSLGQYEESLKYQMKALELRQALLGAQHPDVCESLSNVGYTLAVFLNRFEEGLKYQKEALELRKTLLGTQHPHLAVSLKNVGETLGKLEEYEEALKYQLEALQLFTVLLDDQHPVIASTLNNIGQTLESLERHEEALEYFTKTLEMRKIFFGDQHPEVAQSLNNIGVTLRSLENYEEALIHSMQALEIIQSIDGTQHFFILVCLGNISLALTDLRKYDEALKYQTEALEIRKALFGKTHLDIAQNLSDIGRTFRSLKNRETALKYETEALEMRKILLGEKHSDIAESLSKVGGILNSLKKHEEALK